MNQVRPVFLSIVSGSMRPTLTEGDVVEVERCRAEDLRRGDLVIFKQGSFLICHRFLARAKDGTLRTQGDNLWQADVEGRQCQVEGRVVRILRPGKRPIRVGGPASRWRGLLRVTFRRVKWNADRMLRRRVTVQGFHRRGAKTQRTTFFS